MRVVVQMEYLTRRKNGTFAYRRRVPNDAALALGKREIQFSLKTKDQATALARYHDYHAAAEAELASARKQSPKFVRYEATKDDLVTAGLRRDRRCGP